MKKGLFALLLVAVHFHVQAEVRDTLLSGRVKDLLSVVQKKYAPDKRTEVFNAEVSSSNIPTVVIETTIPDAISAFKKLLAKENIRVDLNERLLPAKELGKNIYGIARLSVCNNRSRPDHAGEMATQMLLGTPVEVLKKEEGHFLVRTPDRYLSWTEGASLRLLDESEFNQWKSSEKIIFTAGYGHSYAGPSARELPVSDLVAGNILQLQGKRRGYYEVVYPDGRKAFVKKKDAQPFRVWSSRPAPAGEAVVSTAKTMVGVPYLWGGTSVKGMDCSGFTKISFFLNGIILPRDASQQALVGESIDIYENDTVSISKCLQNLQAGDLLFFAAGKNSRLDAKVTHTAIYMGNGEFIQAAGLVRINSMIANASNYDDFQSRTLVSARRIITATGSPGIYGVGQHPWYNLTK